VRSILKNKNKGFSLCHISVSGSLTDPDISTNYVGTVYEITGDPEEHNLFFRKRSLRENEDRNHRSGKKWASPWATFSGQQG
jgi:hypothetical protein